VQFTLTVMWRGDGPRGPLFEQQQDLLRTCLQRAASLAKFAYDSESKSLLIETNGARHITHVERRFKNAIRFRLHFWPPKQSSDCEQPPQALRRGYSTSPSPALYSRPRRSALCFASSLRMSVCSPSPWSPTRRSPSRSSPPHLNHIPLSTAGRSFHLALFWDRSLALPSTLIITSSSFIGRKTRGPPTSRMPLPRLRFSASTGSPVNSFSPGDKTASLSLTVCA